MALHVVSNGLPHFLCGSNLIQHIVPYLERQTNGVRVGCCCGNFGIIFCYPSRQHTHHTGGPQQAAGFESIHIGDLL